MTLPPVSLPAQDLGSVSPDCRTVDELYPELSSTLGAAWWSPDVHCQAPGCGRPAMLAVALSVRISPFESRDKTVLSCDLARCWHAWWALDDAVVCDVEPLTPQIAADVTGDEVAAA